MSIEMINGYVCRNCTDVENAKKNINPDKPEDGPFGRDAKDKVGARSDDQAVKFGGALAFLNDSRVNPATGTIDSQATSNQSGYQRSAIDIRA